MIISKDKRYKLHNNEEKLKQLYNDLEFRRDTYRNLAKKYEVNEVTIRRYNVAFGFGRKPIDYNGIKADILSGNYTKDQMAEKYEVDPKTIYNIKRRMLDN
jgi:DNA-binding XRE family transcriptional regulator